MPRVELCKLCEQEVDRESDKFVVVNEKDGFHPRDIAHFACFQKRPQEEPTTPKAKPI
jgi:hypothetical protein